MAEVNQGIKYTVEADTSKAEKDLVSVGKAADKAGSQAIAGFSPMKALTSTLHGDFAGLGSEVAKLVPSFRKMGDGGAAALGAVSAAVFALFKLFGALKDLVKTVFNMNGADKGINALSSSFSKIKNDAANFAETMKEARETAAEMSKRFDETTEAINRMTKAENEFARAQELALAQSEEQKAAINAHYDRLNADADSKKGADQAANKKKMLEDEAARLEEELAESKKRQAEYEANAAKASKRLQSIDTGVGANMWSSVKSFFTGRADNNKIATGAFNASVENRNAAEAEEERQIEIQKKIEANRHALKMANMAIETEEIVEETRAQKELTEDIAVEEKRIDEEQKRREEELEQIRIDAERKIHDLRKRNLADEQRTLTEAQREQADAEARLSAAKSQVSQAWGWYRDKDSMAAQLEEEKANAAAEKQYEKDFDKLKFRRDWRTAKNLSVDEEATRRVALAKEEEAAAQKQVEETAKNTARAADAVEAIRAAIEGADNVD